MLVWYFRAVICWRVITIGTQLCFIYIRYVDIFWSSCIYEGIWKVMTIHAYNLDLDSFHFLETLHTIWQIFLHQKCWTTTYRSSLPSEYSQIVRSSICLTFIGFRRCTKIHINIDSLRVHRSVRPSLYPFYSQNCLHILSKVFRRTARQPTQEVGSIRCGSSRIQKNY